MVQPMSPVRTVQNQSTGAGDRYNAGFVAGHLLGLNPEGRWITGVACSGYFVRNAQSGTASDLAQLIEEWVAGSLQGGNTYSNNYHYRRMSAMMFGDSIIEAEADRCC